MKKLKFIKQKLPWSTTKFKSIIYQELCTSQMENLTIRFYELKS